MKSQNLGDFFYLFVFINTNLQKYPGKQGCVVYFLPSFPHKETTMRWNNFLKINHKTSVKTCNDISSHNAF